MQLQSMCMHQECSRWACSWKCKLRFASAPAALLPALATEMSASLHEEGADGNTISEPDHHIGVLSAVGMPPGILCDCAQGNGASPEEL